MAFIELASLKEAVKKTVEDWQFTRDIAAGIRRRFEELNGQRQTLTENFITETQGKEREVALRTIDERLEARGTQKRVDSWLAFMSGWSRSAYVRKGRLTPNLTFSSDDRLSLTQAERRVATGLADLLESSEQQRLLSAVARMSAEDVMELYESALHSNSLATAGLVLRELRYRKDQGSEAARDALVNAEFRLEEASLPEYSEGLNLLTELRELNGWLRESRRAAVEGNLDQSVLWEQNFRDAAAGRIGPRFLDVRTGITSDELPGAVPSPPTTPEATRSAEAIATELSRGGNASLPAPQAG